MHFNVVVIGDELAAALAPFQCHLEVPPYRRECHCRAGTVPFAFVEAAHATCRLCHGTGIMETTLNPAGRWDSFIVTRGQLVLRPGGRWLRRRDELAGLCHPTSGYAMPDLSSSDWDQAKKGDIDLDAMLAAGWGTYAILAGGVWSQNDDLFWFPSVGERAPHVDFVRSDWTTHVRRTFDAVPDAGTITIIDCHG
jgi:hypothetical protein